MKIYNSFEKESKSENYSKSLFNDSLPETFKTTDAVKIGKEIGIGERSIYTYLKDETIQSHLILQEVLSQGLYIHYYS